MAKAAMRIRTRRKGNEVMQSVMLQWHDILTESGIYRLRMEKCHVAAAALLLLYTHDSNGDGAADFCPRYIPELKKDESGR